MGSVYFYTQGSAEELMRSVKEVYDNQNMYVAGRYELETPVGTYFVDGVEIDRLNSELDAMDKGDGYADGVLKEFGMDWHKSQSFYEKKGPLPAFRMDYSLFLPHDAVRYKQTWYDVQDLVGEGRLFYDLGGEAVTKVDYDDMHSFTELAMQSNLDGHVIRRFKQLLSDKPVTFAFTVAADSFGSGILTLSPNGDLKQHAVLLSLGAVELHGMNPQEARAAIEYMVMHEMGHILINSSLRQANGRPIPTDFMTATSPNKENFKIFERIIAKIPDVFQSGAFGYLTQEACDPVMAEYYGSIEYWAFIRSINSDKVDSLIEKFERNDSSFMAKLSSREAGWSDLWIDGAFSLAVARRLDVDEKKLKKLENYYRKVAKQNGFKDREELFDDLIKWFAAAQKVMSHPEIFKKFREYEDSNKG